jgi:hypothetical protein
MVEPARMRLALAILTMSAGLALAVFMLFAGHISWWFAPLMIAWNLGPLATAWLVSARATRRVAASLVGLAAAYVALAGWGYFHLFFVERSPMAGFAYVVLPGWGWLGLLMGKLIEALAIIWTVAMRR